MSTCPGPLIWFEAGSPNQGAVLECAACSYLIATGSCNDEAHALTSVLSEGLA